MKYISETKLSWKVKTFIVGFKLINKQVTVISIVMETRLKFFVCFTKVTLNFFSGKPKLPLMPKARSPPRS